MAGNIHAAFAQQAKDLVVTSLKLSKLYEEAKGKVKFLKLLGPHTSDITQVLREPSHWLHNLVGGRQTFTGISELLEPANRKGLTNLLQLATGNLQQIIGGMATLDKKTSSLTTTVETSANSQSSYDCSTDTHSVSNVKVEPLNLELSDFSSPPRSLQENVGQQEQQKI